jgi:hypothetical protein
MRKPFHSELFLLLFWETNYKAYLSPLFPFMINEGKGW